MATAAQPRPARHGRTGPPGGPTVPAAGRPEPGPGARSADRAAG